MGISSPEAMLRLDDFPRLWDQEIELLTASITDPVSKSRPGKGGFSFVRCLRPNLSC